MSESKSSESKSKKQWLVKVGPGTEEVVEAAEVAVDAGGAVFRDAEGDFVAHFPAGRYMSVKLMRGEGE